MEIKFKEGDYARQEDGKVYKVEKAFKNGRVAGVDIFGEKRRFPQSSASKVGNTIKTVYLDVDGVLADWIGGLEKFTGQPFEDKQGHSVDAYGGWNKLSLALDTEFYATLPLIEGVAPFYNYLCRTFGEENIVFVTAVSHPVHKLGRLQWLSKVFAADHSRVRFKSAESRLHYAAPDTLLIDDRGDICFKWLERGQAVSVNCRWQPYYEPSYNSLEMVKQNIQLILGG